jgi:tetratricopeptide (TPR) repeat protein
MWFNNLGLATRDLAEPRIRRDFGVGKALPEGELKDLIDEAWEAYSRAVELAPNDPNILNDHALLAVYYLDHSLELADRELRRAIELGEERLSEIDKEAEYEVWRRTDMSVGDAWENLAFLEIMRYHRVVRAPEYLENSSLHWPFERRNGVEMLRREMKKLQQQ